jgi:hypothetical protein
METVCFSEKLTSTDKSTRGQNPEEQHYHPHRRENFKSHNKIKFIFETLFDSFT